MSKLRRRESRADVYGNGKPSTPYLSIFGLTLGGGIVVSGAISFRTVAHPNCALPYLEVRGLNAAAAL